MLKKITNLMLRGSDLFEAEGRLALSLAARVARLFAFLVGICILGSVAALGVLGGLTILLARELGVGWALLIMCSVGLGGAFVIGAAVWSRLGRTVTRRPVEAARYPPRGMEISEMEEHTSEAKSNVENVAADTGPNRGAGGPAAGKDLKETVIEAATRNPAVVISGLFAAATVFGPMRLFRLATMIGTAASVASSVTKAAKEAQSFQNGRVGAPPPGQKQGTREPGHEARTP